MFKFPLNARNISYMLKNRKSAFWLERLDRKNVIDFDGVFENCHGLKSLDLPWNTINAKDIKYFFLIANH